MPSRAEQRSDLPGTAPGGSLKPVQPGLMTRRTNLPTCSHLLIPQVTCVWRPAQLPWG